MRARGGLLRVREFVMKDAYSFHGTEEDFKKEYKKMGDTYSKIFKRLGLKTGAGFITPLELSLRKDRIKT